MSQSARASHCHGNLQIPAALHIDQLAACMRDDLFVSRIDQVVATVSLFSKFLAVAAALPAISVVPAAAVSERLVVPGALFCHSGMPFPPREVNRASGSVILALGEVACV